jgi:hypothetical protein
VVAGLERDIDQVEATVFSGAVAPTERIYSLRREATDFYRAVHPLLAVVTTIERATSAPQLQPYLRDVQDHLLLVNEEVAAQRDLSLQAHPARLRSLKLRIISCTVITGERDLRDRGRIHALSGHTSTTSYAERSPLTPCPGARCALGAVPRHQPISRTRSRSLTGPVSGITTLPPNHPAHQANWATCP